MSADLEKGCRMHQKALQRLQQNEKDLISGRKTLEQINAESAVIGQETSLDDFLKALEFYRFSMTLMIQRDSERQGPLSVAAALRLIKERQAALPKPECPIGIDGFQVIDGKAVPQYVRFRPGCEPPKKKVVIPKAP